MPLLTLTGEVPVADGMTLFETVFGSLAELFTDFMGDLFAEELFLIPLAIFAAGAIIGLVKRVIS